MRSQSSRDAEREPVIAPKAVSRQSATGVGGAGLALQRAVGNDAVVQMLRRAGHAGAQDRHRHGPGCGHADEPGQAEAAQTVQRSAVHDALRGSGRPLDETTRTDMESRLGADFSDVRLYTGTEARRSAARIGARAYTSGNHVVIGEGGGDRHTLAHELTHVIQQRRGPVAGTDNGDGLLVSDPGDRFERAAEANARRALSGPAGAETAHVGDFAPAHGPQGGAGASAVQRVKRGHEESTEGEISEGAVNLIANSRDDTYAGGQGLRIPKTPEGIACWEWAVRAAADSGGVDRGEFWDYLLSMPNNDEVPEIEQLEPAVRRDLDQLRNDIAAEGLSFNFEDLDTKHDEAKILPFMQKSVETFVQAHGLRKDAENPAGWIMCQYKLSGGFGGPEHFWIELPTPGGGRVLLQTVPDIDFIEAGGTDLRWHNENSVEQRQEHHETYQTIEVPVAALKGRHSEIINAIMGRSLRRKPKAAGASGSS